MFSRSSSCMFAVCIMRLLMKISHMMIINTTQNPGKILRLLTAASSLVWHFYQFFKTLLIWGFEVDTKFHITENANRFSWYTKWKLKTTSSAACEIAKSCSSLVLYSWMKNILRRVESKSCQSFCPAGYISSSQFFIQWICKWIFDANKIFFFVRTNRNLSRLRLSKSACIIKLSGRKFWEEKRRRVLVWLLLLFSMLDYHHLITCRYTREIHNRRWQCWNMMTDECSPLSEKSEVAAAGKLKRIIWCITTMTKMKGLTEFALTRMSFE